MVVGKVLFINNQVRGNVMKKKMYYVNHKVMNKFIRDVLQKKGVDSFCATSVADGLVHASLRGVDSHGVRLLPHYLNALASGRITPCPNFSLKKITPSTGILDADNAFGHAAGMKAVEYAMDLAKNSGIGSVAVKRSTHYGAASFFALEISKNDMIGFSFTHSDSLIVPTAAKDRFLGNNPICFTAPCESEDPICLDMATSVITFNKILQLREENLLAPNGVGVDKNGSETNDPNQIHHLLPVGGYKGYGLSLMVEILCSLLTGMPFGPHIPRMYDSPIEEKRNLGHFFMAMRIDAFTDPDFFKKRMKQLVNELRSQIPVNPDIPVQVSGDPEKKFTEERKKQGIPLRETDISFFEKISVNLDLNFQTT